MTDSIKVQKIKAKIKQKVGDDLYLQFLTDLRNPIITLKELSAKYKLSQKAIRNYINTLEYNDGRTRLLIRTNTRVEKRIQERQKRTMQLAKLIMSFNKT